MTLPCGTNHLQSRLSPTQLRSAQVDVAEHARGHAIVSDSHEDQHHPRAGRHATSARPDAAVRSAHGHASAALAVDLIRPLLRLPRCTAHPIASRLPVANTIRHAPPLGSTPSSPRGRQRPRVTWPGSPSMPQQTSTQHPPLWPLNRRRTLTSSRASWAAPPPPPPPRRRRRLRRRRRRRRQ